MQVIPAKEPQLERRPVDNIAPAPVEEVPERFRPSRSTLLIDRFMTQFIKVGGVSIIAVVLAIFVFIFWQILPLFRGANVNELRAISIPSGDYKVIGMDEWSELPFLLSADGSLTFVDLKGNGETQVVHPFKEPKELTAFRYSPETQQAIVGTGDGFFSVVHIGYDTDFQSGKRKVTQKTEASDFYKISNGTVRDIDVGGTDESKLVIAIEEAGGKRAIDALEITQTTSLEGKTETSFSQVRDLTSIIGSVPDRVAVNARGNDFVVSATSGEVTYFSRDGGSIEKVQQFRPFEQSPVALMRFLLGGVSLVFTDNSGRNRIFSLYQHEGGDTRLFGMIHEFQALPGAPLFFDNSLRNKAFLIGNESYASLRFSTTENVRWEERLPFRAQQGVLSGKYNSFLLLDSASKLHLYRLNDPHPESSWRALFGKIWYEGAAGPTYSWQSTGGTDDFEPKLSLVPLVIGTLKGTLYAMIFSIPIALLASVYTSQFLHPTFRKYVKPTMEIMASLPSVVLGFLAALWLAPYLETRVPFALLLLFLLPLTALAFGYFWNLLPIRIRARIKPGYEWLVFIPVMIAVSLLSWKLAPSLERILFVTTDPNTGHRVADFRLWWPQATGLRFEQRNSLVVGFMMGFAVIPIIFTIAEDALSNVPATLVSGSLALGASRWQTAMRVIIPTASAGIFSAIMIGLGRAVGETMIVVMATGNTPILDFNIFSGMRTLSANIAVELPEAPYHATLYRTLFLGAMILFLMTFAVNTLAEVLRQHLREKYRTV